MDKKKDKTFKLHYIGTSMYNPDVFIREAQRHGVQRAISFSQLKTLKFGTPILLAHFIRGGVAQSGRVSDNVSAKHRNTEVLGSSPSTSVQLDTGSNPVPTSSAEVFGYFTVDGISHTLPKDLSLSLQSQLHIIKEDNSPFSVSRACGSYSVGSIVFIKEDLPTLLKRIEELFTFHKKESTLKTDKETVCTCLKCNNPEIKEKKLHTDNILAYCLQKPCECCTSVNYSLINSHKWFINGTFHPLTSFILSPAKFARGIQTVTIDNLNLKKQSKTSSALVWLYNYRQRKYLNKTMKQKLKNKDKNMFEDGWD